STAIAFVSATEGNDTVASWSSTGPAVKLAAPGYRILTTARGGGYSYYSGTSFSSPMAAGLAALTWSAAPGLSASALEEILFSTAKDLGTKGRDEMYGHGRIQALAAVQRAVQLGGAAPAVKLKLPVAGDRGRGTLPVEVVATSQVAIAQVSLLVDGRTVATKSSSPYRFDWDTSNLAAGTHILNASARNAVGTVGWSGAVDVIVDNTTLPHAAPSGPPDGAVLAFSVGEGSGQTVFDASAFENDGILGTSTEAEWEDPSFANGRVGNALLFDGMNDLVTVPDSPSLRITGPITLEAWVWWEPTTQWQPIVARSNWPQRAFGLYVHESRVLHMSYVSSTGKVGAVQSGPGTVPVRQWVHLAGTIDPIGSSMRIYVNGFEVARAPAAGALSPMPGLPLQLGISDASQQDTCRPFKGRLDDVAVLGRLLSADEVATRAGLDRTAPTVRVDSPSNGTAVSGPVTASASAWDASGLRSLRLFVDDLEIGAGNGAPLAVSWDPAAFPGGPHTLRARAVDLNGNEGFSPTVTVTVSHPGAELPDAVLIYHMSEGAGQTTVDSGGIGNTGQLGSLPGPDGADPIWGAGRSGPGLVFDGVDDLVRAVDSSSLRVRQGLTLEAWVWWEPTAQWQPIVARSSWPRRAYGLYLHQSRLLHLSYVSSTGQVGAVQTAGSVVPARQWVHVAGTIDPAANLMTLLVNGVEVARAPAAGWLAEASGLPLQLGMADPSQPDSCRPFKGVLDEVGVYSRPLSTAEIAARAAVDRLPPVVRIDSPADGSTVAGAVTIQASASDNTTVATVRLLVDDVEVGSGSGGTARVVWDTRTCPNGTHAVRARAVDPAGNEAQSTPVSVTVANAAAELPGAVLIYHMSEESGRTAVDSSGHD
ncbi:MAG: S8 family serine peptidase, partial [Candidatus Riflebacteria bacterium]|nr:S8 family serine peptidase [Candidatus Riflebacteria bacterium]